MRRKGLLRGLLNLRLGVNGMQAYTDGVLEHVEKLIGIGFNISDDWIASIILAGLNDQYKPFIMGLEASGVDITSDLVVTKLLDSQTKDESETALAASSHKKKFYRKNNGPRCYNCNQFGHIKTNCKNASSSKTEPNTKAKYKDAKSAFFMKIK
jgi:gag-polypeptide of LTR copia-type/Zinc knuckle